MLYLLVYLPVLYCLRNLHETEGAYCRPAGFFAVPAVILMMDTFMANWDAPSRCTATDCLVNLSNHGNKHDKVKPHLTIED